MEQKNNINLRSLYINAIDTILNESMGVSNETYEFIYKTIYGKYKNLDSFARELEENIGKKFANSSMNVNESFINSPQFTPEEKEEFVNYWTVGAFDSMAKEIKPKGVDFSFIFEKHLKAIMDILSKKTISTKSRKYNGSELFGDGAQDENTKTIQQLKEEILLSLTIGLAIGLIGMAITPSVAKSSPGLCSWARNFKDNFPILSTVIDWTISPLDIDVLSEQDKINKGEIKPGEEGNVGTVEKFMKDHGYAYVKSDTYKQGRYFDEEGNFIGNSKQY